MAEYQGELAGNVHEQVEAPVEEATQTVAEASGEQQEASTQPVGWSDRAEALEQGERLLQAIVDANYAGVLVKLRCEAEQWYVIYQVEGDPEHELVLAQEAEVASLIEMARTGTL
jgi:alpha-glucuronidase